METMWANCLVAGTKTWGQIPASRNKNRIKEILQARVEAGTLTQERYDEIVGE